jgi:hypothetical protein
LKVYIINSITKSYILNNKIRPLVTECALMIKLVDGTSSAHSFNPYAHFVHPWSYFDIQNLRLVILYLFPSIYSVLIQVSTFVLTKLTTPGDNTKMRGVLVVESSTTWPISKTGGSVNFDPRLLMMKDVAQNETRSGRRDLTINILCNSLQALSHSPKTHN